MSILHELYAVREMRRQQIFERFFVGHEGYAHRRLSILRDEGMVTSEVHGYGPPERRVRAAYYRITEKGIELLRKKGRINETNYRARDLELTVKQREYVVDTNELHIKMPEVGYLDSRAIKRKYNLNRGNLTVGGFQGEKGDYMIFLLQENVIKHTLEKIFEEISAGTNVQGYLVYTKSPSVKTHFEQLSEKVGLVTGGVPLHLLPYDEYGVGLTRHYILSNHLPELLVEQGIGKLVQVKGGGSDKYGFRYGLRPLGDETSATPYAIELLTGDPLILRRCLSAYHKGRSQTEGRRVVVICWEDDLPELQTSWEAETHVDFIGVPRTAVKTHFERIEEMEKVQ